MAITNPWQDVMSLRDAMDRLFEESFVRPSRRDEEARPRRYLRLPLDVYTTPDDIVIEASLPGLTPEEVDITVDGDRLIIRGELRPPLENVDYLFKERPYGAFSRTLTLNVPVEEDRAEAVFENGVLRLTLPKSEETKPKAIEVKKR